MSIAEHIVVCLLDDKPLFVYGTLRTGEEAHGKMAGAKKIGKDRTAPKYKLDTSHGYRAMRRNGSMAVSGETYKVDQDKQTELDDWENEEFERGPVEMSDGSRSQAYFSRSRS